jgi:hypothetical protein
MKMAEAPLLEGKLGDTDTAYCDFPLCYGPILFCFEIRPRKCASRERPWLDEPQPRRTIFAHHIRLSYNDLTS